FDGVGRRLERKGEVAGVVVYDDYGHHPTAIRETLLAVRQREPDRRVWAVYEPLTYHRTAALLDEFARALAGADAVAIADIWAGRLLGALARARTTFDGDAWVGLFGENATYQADPFKPPLVGHNALRADILAASETQQQVEFTVERHWVVEPTVLAAWHMSYVDRASKGRVREAGFATLEIGTDGRIERARWWSVRRQGPADDGASAE